MLTNQNKSNQTSKGPYLGVELTIDYTKSKIKCGFTICNNLKLQKDLTIILPLYTPSRKPLFRPIWQDIAVPEDYIIDIFQRF